MLLSPLTCPLKAVAAPLPVDIEVITQPEGVETRAVTVRRGIDLFSESADEVTRAMEEQQERSREEALTGLFDPLFPTDDLTGDERLMSHVTTHGLFPDEVIFRESGEEVQGEEEPTWLFVLVLILCGIAGFVIARLSLQRKERKANVY